MQYEIKTHYRSSICVRSFLMPVYEPCNRTTSADSDNTSFLTERPEIVRLSHAGSNLRDSYSNICGLYHQITQYIVYSLEISISIGRSI